MISIRGRAVFLVVFLTHFLATAYAFVRSFGLSMARFDSGDPASPLETFLGAASKVLSFPILTLVQRIDPVLLPGLAGWIPFVANSALWATAFMLLRYVFRNAAPATQHGHHAG